MDFSLIFQSLLCTTVLFSLWELSLQLFKVFHTEVGGALFLHSLLLFTECLQAMEFPVVATFAGDGHRVIVKCLEATSLPQLQVCESVCMYVRHDYHHFVYAACSVTAKFVCKILSHSEKLYVFIRCAYIQEKCS